VSEDGARRVAARVRASIGAERFDGSFANKAVFRVEGGALEVAAPNKILAGLLERRFGEPLREAAAAELGACPVRFVVAADLFGPHAIAEGESEARSELPAAPARAVPTARKAIPRAVPSERYRLDTFIVGDSNRLVFNAALQLAEGEQSPGGGGAFGPLFVHGPCGVGKTHLLNAVAQRFKENHAGASVRVTGGEAFMNEYVAGVRAGDVEKFRRAFRRVDLLCIDDVHFLSNKQSTQGELLHTLDELERSGARIVLASDEHPRHIKQFSAALVSRFMAGMVAGIQPPDGALREKCVRMFARQRGLTLEPGAIDLLVQRTGQLPGQTPATIRDIEGLVTRIDALHRLVPDYADQARGAGEPIGVLLVERALGHSGGSTVVDPNAPARASRPVRIDAIMAHTCAALAVDSADLSGKTRHPRVVLSRAIITHLARQMTTLSYPEIARAIGRPNHSTVITAFQRFAKQLAADEAVDAPGAPEARTLSVLVRQISAAAQSGRR
jgi:chromosomal replication initiator protein